MSCDNSLLSLPNNSLPDCWNDESRMNVLFAPFRTRSVNPHDWDTKLGFWRDLIHQCCVYSKVYTFKATDLQRLFSINGRSPGCLNIVIDEMYKSGDIKPVEQFLQKPAQTWHRWAADVFIKKPLLWSYCKIKDTLVSANVDHTYVHLEAVKTEAENVLASLPDDLRNKVISLEQLFKTLQITDGMADGMKLILHYLVCTGKADVKEIEVNTKTELASNSLLIKFGNIKQMEPVSDIDVSIYILEQNEKTLMKDLEKLEKEVLSITAQAKSYLLKGQRQMAKNHLRKRHEVESRVVKKANTLQNVQTLIMKIRDADVNTQVVDSYKRALSTLKKTFKDTGLSEDLVFDTMAELGDVLDIHQEIEETLSKSISENDEDFEDELAELMKDDDNASSPSNLPPPVKVVKEENAELNDLKKRLENLNVPEVPMCKDASIKTNIAL